MESFYHTLLDWYNSNKRDLPWRRSQDPYLVWLSEIILQQTRVDQGMAYFKKFQEEFPSVNDLAKASEEKVLKLWEGLGYYSRGRNLLATAKIVSSEYNGQFPDHSKELQRLKGVGPYTAAAIASIAFKEKIGAVDGNVYRVLSRFFDINLDITLPKTRKYFETLSTSLIEGDEPGEFNQALMDFGSSICTPKKANCLECPFTDSCLAKQKKIIYERPVKTKKIKVTDRYLHYFLFESEDKILVEKRTKGIWIGLHQFPLLESESSVVDEKVLGKEVRNLKLIEKFEKPHKLSHQNLFIHFWKVDGQPDSSYKEIDYGKLKELSWPKPLKDFIDREF